MSTFVISILLVLLVPSVGAVRRQAAETKSQSNLRTLSSLLSQYAADSEDSFPSIETGRAYPRTWQDGVQTSFMTEYWVIFSGWPGLTHYLLRYDHTSAEIFVSPGSARFRDQPVPWPTSYHLSMTVGGMSSLWSGHATADPALAKAARTSDVTFPSSKGLLWDTELGWYRDEKPRNDAGDVRLPSPMAMADGSVSSRVPADASEPVFNPLGLGNAPRRIHDTRNGVRGIDYP